MPTNNLLSPPLSQESIFCSLLALSTLNNSVELYCKESRTYLYRIHNESKNFCLNMKERKAYAITEKVNERS